ncbi:FtsW/RodA/SpoVE family cell cycle protein [Candidatus Oleimmundimicrobium sp.]|uniref:FtsW/RodA/SpoVE family cell cycle protein n=1 Tax=Candidatus Oleimmundimicrobium sp. TaxID=3060597 RepID=UPI00271657A1|nr:FtsW/RodA/SpoVE family cell cycle protein [Candidatus Oleimmundimicrobium sp.]MDO8886812.1 FtsW/RodA/SpoVE family cell cycle protein [Candidatus Oleimmundimicrobium sp.]
MLNKRNRETILFLLVFLCVLIGVILVDLSNFGGISMGAVFFIGILFLLFLAAHLSCRFFLPNADYFFLPSAFFLVSLGTIMIYRLKPDLVWLQLLWVGLSILATMLVLIFFGGKNYRLIKNYKYVCALTGVVLLLLPAFLGREIHGAKLWLRIGSLSFQPAEVAKILIIIFLAAYLKEKSELLSTVTRRVGKIGVPDLKHFGPLLVMWAVSLIILIFEKDLGSSLLFFGTFLAILYVATGRVAYIIAGGALFVVGATACYGFFPHVQTRIDIWLNPWLDANGKGYQIAQSLFAIASGGISGSGLGQGFPLHIPAVHTDFIFSAICEELGFLGGVAVSVVYLLIAYRGLKVGLQTEDIFGKLLAVGLTSIFAIQSWVIMAGVTRLIPLTGITLPFMSYGGSSMLSNFILLGFLLSISAETSSENNELLEGVINDE